MIAAYWITVAIISLLIIFIILIKMNLILKNTRISNFIQSSLFKYICKRFVFSIFILFSIVTINFILIYAFPSNYSNNINSLGRDYYNLTDNKNFISKLVDFYYNVLPFPKKICTSTYLNDGVMACSNYEYKIINLGYSSSYMINVGVWSIIKEKSSISFLISFIGYSLQCLIGYPLGVYLAKKKNKFLNACCDLLTTSIIIPSIIYFYLFLLLFMVVFKLPVVFDVKEPLSYIAPLVSLTLWSCFVIAYWVRKYITLEYDKDYVKLAYSKGLDEKTIFYKHIMKNALIPLIRTIPVSLVLCFSGSYLFESTFNIPGMGLTFINAINLQDVYLIQGLVIFYSILSITAYFIGDLITVIMNPKVKLGKEEYNE